MKLTEFVERYGDRNVDEKELKDLVFDKENKIKLSDFIKEHGDIKVDKNTLKEIYKTREYNYFVPATKERYYFVMPGGWVKENIWNNDGHKNILEHSWVFETKEEAKEHAERRKFLIKMKRDFLDNSDEIKWNNEAQNKYYLVLSHLDENIEIDYTKCVTPIVYFVTTNKKWLEEYIKEYEKEIKKYYFGIKEEK